eukprot:gene8555-biopygen18135
MTGVTTWEDTPNLARKQRHVVTDAPTLQASLFRNTENWHPPEPDSNPRDPHRRTPPKTSTRTRAPRPVERDAELATPIRNHQHQR